MSVQIEQVESRLHLAGQNEPSPVTVKLSQAGTLFINGTSERDNIQVIQSHGGGIAIKVNNLAPTFLDNYGFNGKGKQIDIALVKRISIHGMGNKDTISVNMEKDIPALLQGGAGVDSISTTSTRSTLIGGTGDDTLFSNGAVNRLLATSFRFANQGTFASQWQVYGGNGAVAPLTTNLAWQNTSDRNVTLTTDDTTVFVPSLNTNWVTVGSDGNRQIINAIGNRLEGGSGNDRIYTSGAEDSVYGGDGNDTVLKQNDLEVYFADLEDLAAVENSNDAPSRLAAFEVESIVPVSAQITTSVIVRRNSIEDLRSSLS